MTLNLIILISALFTDSVLSQGLIVCNTSFGPSAVSDVPTETVATSSSTSTSTDYIDKTSYTSTFTLTTPVTYVTVVGNTTSTVPTKVSFIPVIDAPTNNPTGTPSSPEAANRTSAAAKSSARAKSTSVTARKGTSSIKSSAKTTSIGKASTRATATTRASAKRTSSLRGPSPVKSSSKPASPETVKPRTTPAKQHPHIEDPSTTSYPVSVDCTEYDVTVVATTTTVVDFQNYTLITTLEIHTTSAVATATAYAACDPANNNLVTEFKDTPVNSIGSLANENLCQDDSDFSAYACANPTQCCNAIQSQGGDGFAWTANATEYGYPYTGIACLSLVEWWFDIGAAPSSPYYIGNGPGPDPGEPAYPGSWGG